MATTLRLTPDVRFSDAPSGLGAESTRICLGMGGESIEPYGHLDQEGRMNLSFEFEHEGKAVRAMRAVRTLWIKYGFCAVFVPALEVAPE